MKFGLTSMSLILSSILMTFSYDSFSQQEESENYLIFGQIDNKAQVFVNEKKIFESEFIEGGGYLYIDVPLDEHMVKGKNLVTVVLINGTCEDCLQNPWGIEYEIYEEDDLTSTISESSMGEGGNSSGEVWSETHEFYFE
jgi:hypothetical protein